MPITSSAAVPSSGMWASGGHSCEKRFPRPLCIDGIVSGHGATFPIDVILPPSPFICLTRYPQTFLICLVFHSRNVWGAPWVGWGLAMGTAQGPVHCPQLLQILLEVKHLPRMHPVSSVAADSGFHKPSFSNLSYFSSSRITLHDSTVVSVPSASLLLWELRWLAA